MAGLQLKAKKDAAAVKEGGSSFITTSGVYDAVIDFVSLEETEKGAVRFNLNLDVNGNKQTIYGNTIQNTDGSENEIGMRLLNKLFVLAGFADGQEPDIDTETHKVGKDQKAQDFTVITDLTGMPIKIQIKEKFSKYNGEIKQSREPYNFFRAEDGATAAEIVEAETGKTIKFGDQLAKILAKEATTKPLYVENKQTGEPAPTDAEVIQFLASRSTSSNTPTASSVTPSKKKLFGQPK